MNAKPREEPVKSVESTGRNRAIGNLLVDAGRLTEAEAKEIQSYAENTGMRFGEAAVALNRISVADIDSALARQFNYAIVPHGPGEVVADEVVAAYRPQSDVAEDLRTIRSRLVIDWLSPSERNILTVISPGRGEGRSWFAANLATLFAQAGERTLLIDADLRNPRQHQLFELNNTMGLAALLTGRAGKETAQRVHPDLRLFVMPAGVLPPNPQELLTRPVFDIVLDRLARQFDVVLVDTPAAQDSADAQVIATKAGAALILARRHHTSEAALKLTLQSLNRSKVKLVGSVMNEHD
jgi:chain length determinant protein tyrosine kinase EpsG